MSGWTWRGMPRSRARARRGRGGGGRSGGGVFGAGGNREALAVDGGVLASAVLLSSVGVVMIYSTTAPLAIGEPVPPHLLRHGVAVAAGLVAAAVALRVPLRLWRRAALPLWGVCCALLLATLFFGIEANGARRWLAIPGVPFSLQAAELAKWATLLAVAAVLAEHPRAPGRGRVLLASVALALVPCGLLLLQPDLGNALVLAGLVGVLLFAAGVPLLRLLGPALGAVAATALYIAANPYALARLRGFLHPWETARSEGFQLVQSFVAFGRGGIGGVGLGDGRQKLFYLPEAHTDFILSVVAEELGLFGVLVVLGAFAAFVVAGTRLARQAREPFALLVAFGMTALVAVPAALNGAVVMGLVPTTGLTLPFLSFGGNSFIVCSFAVGILLRIGTGADREGRRR